MIKPTRRSQPYRKGQQMPGPTLDAMLRGKPFLLPNPIDQKRSLDRLLAQLRRGR